MKEIDQVILIFASVDLNKSPHTQIYKYEITDDGIDIMDYIEDRTTTISKEYVDGEKEYINNMISNDFKVDDLVCVYKNNHPLDGRTGIIKEINKNICITLIDKYVFNIPPGYLKKIDY